MFKYRSKEYASSSEALDDYIRNFDFQNYENELSRKLNKTIHSANDREFSKTCDSNTNRQKTTTNTLKSSLLSKNSENLIEIGEEKSEFKEIEINALDVSATQIREDFAMGKTPETISPSVLNYIKDRGLYGSR